MEGFSWRQIIVHIDDDCEITLGNKLVWQLTYLVAHVNEIDMDLDIYELVSIQQ